MADEKLELTRRKALAGLGTIGAASAGAGLGTTAYLNDTEEFNNNSLQAGTLNLLVACDVVSSNFDGVDVTASGNDVTFDNSEDPDPFDTSSGSAVVMDGNSANISINLDDVKPGDSFVLKKCIKVEGNPAYVRAVASNVEDGKDTGTSFTEPEGDTADTDGSEIGGSDGITGTGELDNEAMVTVGGGWDGSSITSEDTSLSGTLNQHLKDLSDGEGIDFESGGNKEIPAGTVVCQYIKFDIPDTVGNEIQGDSVRWDLSFQAVQTRHNDDSNGDPFANF